jgi:hypothetical protein
MAKEVVEQALPITRRGSSGHPGEQVRLEMAAAKLPAALKGQFDRIAPGLSFQDADFELGILVCWLH